MNNTPASIPQIALTLVGPAGTRLETRLVKSILQRAGLEAVTPDWLSDTGDLHAVEAVTDMPEPAGMAALEDALSQVLSGSRIDGVIRPAHNRRKRLLICDMDSTVIGQECLDELADFAGLKAEIAAITERAMRGELDFEAALKTRVAMLKGLGTDALAQCYETRIRLSTGARTLVRTMHANGARCLLVSGGFTYFTSRVAAAAGFHADRANELIIRNDRLTGEVKLPILGRQAKLETLLQTTDTLGLEPDDSLAIGDGANDLAMIEAAGLGIAYKAKPIVAAKADCQIRDTDLTTALFFQGYRRSEFAS